jgi:hypothetical protein
MGLCGTHLFRFPGFQFPEFRNLKTSLKTCDENKSKKFVNELLRVDYFCNFIRAFHAPVLALSRNLLLRATHPQSTHDFKLQVEASSRSRRQ